MKVPFVDLAAQQAEVADEVRAGVGSVFERTAFVGGPEVARFEAEYARLVDTQHCVGVGNGTDALELALRAVGVGPGDEVIIPANTFIASAEAVSRAGAEPVVVDVDEQHLLIDPRAVERAITARTKAIVPVHLFGQSAFVEQLTGLASSAGVAIVEDAAQSQGALRHGRAAGSVGAVAATSFYPGKNLGAAGDAGAVTTDDDDIAVQVRLLANHGSRVKYAHEVPGMNSRMDTIQAVVLLAKLARLEKWNRMRRDAATYYDELLAGVAGVVRPTVAAGNDDVWHLYVIRVADRDRVRGRLHAHGIETGIHYPEPVHLTAAYSHLDRRHPCPVAERAAGEILSLPMFPHLEPEQQEYVIDVLDDALRGG